MQNIIPPEWMAVLVTIGTVLGTVILGLFYSRKPPAPEGVRTIHPGGLLVDSTAVRELRDSLDSVGQILQEGLTNVCIVLQNKRDEENRDLLEEILEELKKAPQPPKPRR